MQGFAQYHVAPSPEDLRSFESSTGTGTGTRFPLVLTPQLFCKLRLRVAIASSREVVTHPPRPRRCPEVGETYLEAGPKPNHVVRTHSWHPNPRQSPGILQPSCSHLARAVLVCLRGASLHSYSCTKHMPARPMVRTNSP